MGTIDKTLYILSMILSASSLILCTLVCVSILSCPKSRSRGFNTYLIFLLLPDIFLNLNTIIIYAIELSEDKFLAMISFEACAYAMIIYGNYLFCNMWTSALICYEVHQLLFNSYNAVRYEPSKPLTVIKRVSILQFLGFSFSSIPFLILPLFGIRTSENSCLGIRTKETEIVLYFYVCGVTTVLPFSYICYVSSDIYRKKLLPPTGNSRFLATFFCRTTIITTILTIIIMITLLVRTDGTTTMFLFCICGQGFIISGLSITKPDIRRAFSNFISCGTIKTGDSVTNKTTCTVVQGVDNFNLDIP